MNRWALAALKFDNASRPPFTHRVLRRSVVLFGFSSFAAKFIRQTKPIYSSSNLTLNTAKIVITHYASPYHHRLANVYILPLNHANSRIIPRDGLKSSQRRGKAESL